MGGTTFEDYGDGATVDEAFRSLREQAMHDHGHGGYSGTIAEKGDYVVITRTPMSRVEAGRLAEKLIEDGDSRIDDKWGPAGAIPVITGERTVQVDIDRGYNDDWSYSRRNGKEPAPEVLTYLKDKKVLKRGDTVVSISLFTYSSVDRGYGYNYAKQRAKFTKGKANVVIRDNLAPTERKVKVAIIHPGPVNWDNRPEWEAAAVAKVTLKEYESAVGFHLVASDPVVKVTATADSKVKPETRYVIPNTKHATWENGFNSQAEARAAAISIAENASTGWTQALSELEVIGLTKRAGNKPLVSVTRTTKKTLATIEVTVLKVPPRPNAQPDGWLFFGWASC